MLLPPVVGFPLSLVLILDSSLSGSTFFYAVAAVAVVVLWDEALVNLASS